MKLLALRIMQSHLALFAKNCFPTIFGAILKFCIKRKNAFIIETVLDRALLTKCWVPSVSQSIPLKHGGHKLIFFYLISIEKYSTYIYRSGWK